MTITGSGNPLSLNDLNVEFNRGATSQLSLSQSFAGTYAQYGAINRNTSPGQNVTNVFNVGTDFDIYWFYDYNDTENNYWDYTFTNDSVNDVGQIQISIGGTDIYLYNTFPCCNFQDATSGFIDTTTSATTGANLDLAIKNTYGIAYVDILVIDPDTSATIYTVTGDDPNNYGSFPTLATLYGYQRMQWTMTFYD
jgi:hypothetical protein